MLAHYTNDNVLVHICRQLNFKFRSQRLKFVNQYNVKQSPTTSQTLDSYNRKTEFKNTRSNLSRILKKIINKEK